MAFPQKIFSKRYCLLVILIIEKNYYPLIRVINREARGQVLIFDNWLDLWGRIFIFEFSNETSAKAYQSRLFLKYQAGTSLINHSNHQWLLVPPEVVDLIFHLVLKNIAKEKADLSNLPLSVVFL
jgi:hypothetical protein